MIKNNIAIIGSTGSVGKSAVEVIKTLNNVNVTFLVAEKNFKSLANQAKEVNASSVIIIDETKYSSLKEELKGTNIKAFCGTKAVIDLINENNSESIIIANYGFSAFEYIISALKANKDLYLCNKEAIVCAGSLIKKELLKSKSKIIPLDSEHNAVYQVLEEKNKNSLVKLYLTASGGPFWGYTNEELKKVTLDNALKHPKWSMGREISINSATLMNKGLEIIEAYYLFDVAKNKIEPVLHKEAILHGAVNYEDGSLLGVFSFPDMRLPLSYAINALKRVNYNNEVIDIFKLNGLSFEKIDINKVKSLKLSVEALKAEGNAPCILNIANEIAVDNFLQGKIKFIDIVDIVDYTINKLPYQEISSKEDVIETFNLARDTAINKIKNII